MDERVEFIMKHVRVRRPLDGKMVPLPKTDQDAIHFLCVQDDEIRALMVTLYMAARADGTHPTSALMSVYRSLQLFQDIEEVGG